MKFTLLILIHIYSVYTFADKISSATIGEAFVSKYEPLKGFPNWVCGESVYKYSGWLSSNVKDPKHAVIRKGNCKDWNKSMTSPLTDDQVVELDFQPQFMPFTEVKGLKGVSCADIKASNASFYDLRVGDQGAKNPWNGSCRFVEKSRPDDFRTDPKEWTDPGTIFLQWFDPKNGNSNSAGGMSVKLRMINRSSQLGKIYANYGGSIHLSGETRSSKSKPPSKKMLVKSITESYYLHGKEWNLKLPINEKNITETESSSDFESEPREELDKKHEIVVEAPEGKKDFLFASTNFVGKKKLPFRSNNEIKLKNIPAKISKLPWKKITGGEYKEINVFEYSKDFLIIEVRAIRTVSGDGYAADQPNKSGAFVYLYDQANGFMAELAQAFDQAKCGEHIDADFLGVIDTNEDGEYEILIGEPYILYQKTKIGFLPVTFEYQSCMM